MLLSQHFANNQRCISYSMQVAHIRCIADIYAMRSSLSTYEMLTTVMLVDIQESGIIVNARMSLLHDQDFDIIINKLKDIYYYIYSVEPDQLPLKINDQSVLGDISRAMMSGKLTIDHLKDEWGSFIMPHS